jgi:multicomponent Na+:H+ antiporter subunit C
MEYLGLWNYWAVIILMMTGLYIVIARDNLVKKMMGLSIFQVSAIMLYVSMGKVTGGTAPILPSGPHHTVIYDPATLYSNPLPHVLMLTAIVVGIATTALGLSIVVRIYEAYGTAEEDEIVALDGQEQ